MSSQSVNGDAAPIRTSRDLIAQVLQRSSLSQAELARRSGLARSVLNAYLHGTREPGADTLMRVVAAGGLALGTRERRSPVDPQRAGQILEQVLGLAEALPYRPRAEIEYPRLADRIAAKDR